MAADSVLLKRASQDAISSLRKDEDVIVAALRPLQLSAACGVSANQVSEAVPVHDTYVVSSIAPIRSGHQLLAVLPLCVGYSLAGEIAMDKDRDLAGEVGLPVCTELFGYLPAVLSDRPLAIDEHSARETQRLTAEQVDPAIAELAVHETPLYVLSRILPHSGTEVWGLGCSS
ncbi:hypothetical protein [Streptomyces sp. NPDC126933]|uniref:hypothetical protein n=1 Tax=unclassified Streptomyces TaxID=2593676 RepID=UPI0036462466